MNFVRSTRVVVWVAAALFLGALGLRDLQLDRTLALSARFDRATPYLSTLGPRARIVFSSNGAMLIGEPAYLDLRVPRWFMHVVVELVYENPHHLPFRFGVRTHPTQWQYEVKTVEIGAYGERNVHPDVDVRQEGDRMMVRVPLTLSRAWQAERNVSQFIFSVPGATPETPFTIHEFRVTAVRESICFKGFCL